ncbi:hypothetical protein C7974DRAFT_301623 [Boeremia exigua]|uniref:uncharacterized protein n=1 Tax=Boeremia exigua TaxID=749465 RepID=UPI001E8E5E84|nr:uncharacterized protein C7974DRAFT_301623 [Boeremia exigua]KAH6642307.1 hypothetical protein C7974DRAFT_301623 [Boeremia exigua]
MRVDTYAEDTIKSLLRERDQLQVEAAKHKEAYESLQRRVYKRAVADVDLPAEVVRRLNQLENETDRYKSENKLLREDLHIANSEIATLKHEIAGQMGKLKGAGKKVRNAKAEAGQQEEKAKGALQEKQSRAASEKKMKQERNEAVAKVASLTKLCDNLQASLDVEQAGRPHLRKDQATSDEATAVIPIELTIQRAHFLRLSTIFASNQISITEELQRWYNDWRKPKEPVSQVVGANYLNDGKKDKKVVDWEKIYADLVELDGHQQTGAEHDGPRSKRSLKATCRRAEERHNSQC